MVGKGNGSTLRVTPSEVVFLVVTLEGMEATEVVPFVPSFPVVHSSMLVAGMAEVLKWHYYALIRLLYSVLFASVPSKFMIGHYGLRTLFEPIPKFQASIGDDRMGHLIPFVELAKRLVLSHNFSVTCIVPTIGSPSKAQETVLKCLPHGISYVFLPAVSFDDLKEDVRAEIKVSLTMSRSLSPLREVLKSIMIRTRLVALIVDPYGTDAFDLAEEFGVPSYIFFMSNAMALSFCLHLPKLDEMISCEYRDLPEPVKIPGCIPVQGRDLMDPVRDRKNEAYKGFLHHVKRFTLAEGIIVNSCMDLEAGAVRALQDGGLVKPPVYPVGPLVRTWSRIGDDDDSECLRWLDGQPDGSVLYVSFGSGGTLSYDQVNELALGLEMSEQRFLWVLRTPNDRSSNAAYLTNQSQNDAFDYLPKGFRDRTRGQGLILPSWAPQIRS
ncbi:Hydroquinone glucosyltransferase [Vitis vinifera]|uniref:Hydroquinone glucosyltransferase n=1 Tax=Vitis vinifera TaxID=29760 RepID=A0A438FR05_VITVI|nr:Hydroquinone glucosyltransferase [Vitis vinifera]